MPVREILWWDGLATVFCISKVDNQRVPPLPRGWVDAVLTATQLADGRPGTRRKHGRVKLPVGGHVGTQARPGGLVVGIHSKASPHIGGHFFGLFSGEGFGDSAKEVRRLGLDKMV